MTNKFCLLDSSRMFNFAPLNRDRFDCAVKIEQISKPKKRMLFGEQRILA